jgi:hypothetical protein
MLTIIRGHTMPGRDCFTDEAHTNVHVGVHSCAEPQGWSLGKREV